MVSSSASGLTISRGLNVARWWSLGSVSATESRRPFRLGTKLSLSRIEHTFDHVYIGGRGLIIPPFQLIPPLHQSGSQLSLLITGQFYKRILIVYQCVDFHQKKGRFAYFGSGRHVIVSTG